MDNYDEYKAREKFENAYKDYIFELIEKAEKILSDSGVVKIKEKNVELTRAHTFIKYWSLFKIIYKPSEVKKLEVDWEKVALSSPKEKITIWKEFDELTIDETKLDLLGLAMLDIEISALLNQENLNKSFQEILDDFDNIILQKRYSRILKQLNTKKFLRELKVMPDFSYEEHLAREVVAYKHFYDNEYEKYIESLLDIPKGFHEFIDQVIEIYDANKGSYINSKISEKFRHGCISVYGFKFRDQILEIADVKIEAYKSSHGKYPHEIIWDFYKEIFPNIPEKQVLIEKLKKLPIDLNVEFRLSEAGSYLLGGNMTRSEGLKHIKAIDVDGYKDEPDSSGFYHKKRVFESDIPKLLVPNWIKTLISHNYAKIVREAENEIRDENNKYKIGGRWLSENNVYETLRKKLPKDTRIIREKWISIRGAKRLDFYLPDHKLAIEYNGIQHYEPIEFFGGKKGLKARQESDSLKKKYCKERNILLKVIKYDEDIKKCVNSIIKELE
jgi:hypothetical protein